MRRELEYISTGRVPVKDLITRHIPLDNVPDAFQFLTAQRTRPRPQP